MTMRILHVFDHSLPLHSGYTFRSRALIVEQRRLGWDTFHLTSSKHPAGGRSDEVADGLVFHRTEPGLMRALPVMNQWDVVRTLVPRIIELARRHSIDLIHAHSPCLNGLAALRAGAICKLPVVYEVRAFWEDAAVDHGTARERGARYRLGRALESRVLKRAQQITCICEGLRQDIVARGIPPESVTVIPNAVDIENFPLIAARDEELMRSLGLGLGKVLGFIGSFYGYEGLDLMLAAMPRILARLPDTRLLLVGGGPQEATLIRQAERLGLGDRVIFTGRVPHERVPAYSSLVDAFVFPRKSMRLTDLVTPLKPLEAMAQGRLVLASDVGGHRELIDDGITGLLFRHDDVEDLARCAIDALDRPEASLQAIIATARRKVESERNWKASVQRYRQVYARACSRRS